MSNTDTTPGKAFIKVFGSGFTFLHFYNSKEIYSRKGFDSERKARNYAKKYGYDVTETLPEGIV